MENRVLLMPKLTFGKTYEFSTEEQKYVLCDSKDTLSTKKYDINCWGIRYSKIINLLRNKPHVTVTFSSVLSTR